MMLGLKGKLQQGQILEFLLRGVQMGTSKAKERERGFKKFTAVDDISW